MKRYELLNAFNFLNGLKLNALSKETRKTVLTNHLRLVQINNEYNEVIREAQKKLFEGKDELISEYNNLKTEIESSSDIQERIKLQHRLNDEFGDVIKSELEFNNIVNSYRAEDVEEIKLDKLNKYAFIDELINAEVDVTPQILTMLEILFEE